MTRKAKYWDNKVIERWNNIMYDIGCEHTTIATRYSEIFADRALISIKELYDEAEYWLSCYYESGNCRCDDRFLGDYEYKVWRSETGKLKRLLAFLDKHINTYLIVEYEEGFYES